MELEKEVKSDKIEVVHLNSGYPLVQVRTAITIKENGVQISRNFHRHVLTPDADLSAEDADVVAVAKAVFTAQAKQAYQNMLDELNPKIQAQVVE